MHVGVEQPGREVGAAMREVVVRRPWGTHDVHWAAGLQAARGSARTDAAEPGR